MTHRHSGNNSSKGERVTAVSIDGNTLQAAAVSLDAGATVNVHKLATMELDELVERVSRASHPIFMDVDFIEYPDQEYLHRALRALVEEPEFDNPFVGVMPAESVQEWRREGLDEPGRRERRLLRGLQSFQSANPYAYPKMFGYSVLKTAPGVIDVEIWSSRFDDVTVVAEQYTALINPRRPFRGLVTGRRAIREMLFQMSEATGEDPVTMIDLGKLRTVYSGQQRGRPVFTQAIPVGLARDDVHYFRAVPIRTDEVIQLADEVGSLLYPPDVTPSPLFDPQVSSPQVDCTRFSVQVARYAYRVLHDLWSERAEAHEVRCVLTGLPTRLTSLRDFIEAKTGAPMFKLERSLLPRFQLGPGLNWNHVGYHCVPIGAAVAYLRRNEWRQGLILRDRRPVRLEPEQLGQTSFSEEDIYVIEAPSSDRDRSVRTPSLPPIGLDPNETDFDE